MRIQLLPSTFDETGRATSQQHLPCFVIDDCVAIDAGSLALSVSNDQRESIRDILLTHAHLDHIATLPSFIDDLFAELEAPVRIHALEDTINTLETHVFNWKIFPRFSELNNDFGAVLVYSPITEGEKFAVKHLEIIAIPVNHQVASVGFVISDKNRTVAFTSDTAETDVFWEFINGLPQLDGLFIECAFPNRHSELARLSHHLIPDTLKAELAKFAHNCRILAINLKPMYREEIVVELESLRLPRLEVMQARNIYEF